MEFLDQQINPPKTWEKFEELSRALFAAIWKDPLASRHGRTGQKQHGVDVHGCPPSAHGRTYGVQCKGKDQHYGKPATVVEFDAELLKVEQFMPSLGHWTFTTTHPDDAVLQAHARAVSEIRVAAGKFPVVAFGWGTFQALLAQHSEVIEQFYPELGFQLPDVIRKLSALPDQLRAVLDSVAPQSQTLHPEAPEWIEERFETARDLGPALLGRPLGPADVSACPELPQVDRLWRELEAGYSARLGATAGAGKSVCALQVAKRAHDQGWRVVRLRDPSAGSLDLATGDRPTLHIVDDAHLTDPALLLRVEQQCSATRWLLSAHTLADDKVASSGTMRINPGQAVAVIAAGLRADIDATRRVVQRVDDRIGLSISSEWIEDRLDEAEKAERPWQFCFILGGGWRRARQSAEDAKAAGADLVLAAAAVRQLASRDARASLTDLGPLLDAAGIAPADRSAAIDWLVRERLLLGADDLRCPHQRLSVVLIARILEGQDEVGRKRVGAMVNHVITGSAFTLAGLSLLLTEWRMMGEWPTRWAHLVDRPLLLELVERCWRAEEAIDRRGAAWLLSELQSYLEDWVTKVTTGHEETVARWFDECLPGTGYAVGHLLGQFGMKDRELTATLIDHADPLKAAAAVSRSDPALAGEAGAMIYACMGYRSEAWTRRFIAAVDRPACNATIQSWPKDQYLSGADELLRLLIWDDQEFGLDLFEAFIPAIAERLRAQPAREFHELHDLVWHGLRLTDSLGLYRGAKGPTARMRAIGKKLASVWAPADLAKQIASVSPRQVQPAGWLLMFIGEVSRRQFNETVALIDWEQMDRTIGERWARMDHDMEVLIHVCFAAPAAKAPIQAMILRNVDKVDVLSVRLAMLAPEAAVVHFTAGRQVALSSYDHFSWRMSAALVAQLAEAHADLLDSMIAPHVAVAAEQLSSKTQPFFGEPLPFLRVIWQVAPVSFELILAAIDPAGAEAGWAAALRGEDAARHAPTSDREQKVADRQTAGWLVERALRRSDALGDVARRLRKRLPRKSVPSPKSLEVFKAKQS
ncbi:MAG: hypothetical protein V4459_00815 [Pseudomonadota bacterium]